jgi:hypothetical protein
VNTEALARLEQLPTDVQQTWLRICDRPIEPFNGHPRRRGGHLVTDKYAPGWWVLADAEGNETRVTTRLSSD